MENFPDEGEHTVTMLAATPKPRIVKLALSARGEDTFSVGKASYKAARYLAKVEIGVAGVVAPLVVSNRLIPSSGCSRAQRLSFSSQRAHTPQTTLFGKSRSPVPPGPASEEWNESDQFSDSARNRAGRY